MGYRELVSHLQKEGEEKIQQLWADVKKQAEQVRSEAADRTGEIRSAYEKDQSIKAGDQAEIIISESRRKARSLQLSAEQALAERLYETAHSLLPTLRDDRYRDIFSSICREIPESDWSDVKVHPQDEAMARSCYADTRIETDNSISGGLSVRGSRGKTAVVNTFEKRLEKAWEDLLPLIIKDIKKGLSDDETY